MIQVKHFIDNRWLTSNAGYKSLETNINEFIADLHKEHEGHSRVIDIKYSSVFNSLWTNPNDVYTPTHGLIQVSALVIYEIIEGRRL